VDTSQEAPNDVLAEDQAPVLNNTHYTVPVVSSRADPMSKNRATDIADCTEFHKSVQSVKSVAGLRLSGTCSQVPTMARFNSSGSTRPSC